VFLRTQFSHAISSMVLTGNIYQINLSFFTLFFFQNVCVQTIFATKKYPKLIDLQFAERKKLQILILTFGHTFDIHITKDTLIEFLLSILLHDLLEFFKGKGKMELRFFDYSASNSI
jgi:hypothetical protein